MVIRKNTPAKYNRLNIFSQKPGLRVLSLILCLLMLCAAAASCSRTKKSDDNAEGYIFSGGAYKNDAVTSLPPELREVSITANGSTSNIITTNTVFSVKTAGKTDTATLTQHLAVKPEIAFAVQQKSDTEFLLYPLGAGLDEGKIYNFTVGNPENPALSFVFQTENELRVKSIIPTDKAVGVPLNTGIEIAFTQIVRNADFKKYITISPKTSGHFDVYPDGKTVVFVPEKNLAENTIYTVEVKRGIESSSGKVLEVDYTSKFRTGSTIKSNSSEIIKLYTTDGELVFSPDEYPVLNFIAYNTDYRRLNISFDEATVKLYRYAGAKDAADALKNYELVRGEYITSDKAYLFPTGGLKKVGEYSLKVNQTDDNSYNRYITLPQQEPGIYLVSYTISGKTGEAKFSHELQAIIQITNLRLRTESFNGSTLFWTVYKDGNLASGAEVKADFYTREPYWSVDGGKTAFTSLSGKTGNDGVLILENGNTNAGIVCVSHGGEELVVTMLAKSEQELEYYAKFIYTDREVYFSDDLVNFRGLITPLGDAKLPGRLYLYFGSVPCGSISVNSDGSFEGSIPIENYSGWGMYLSFRNSEGKILFQKYIRVTQTDKPTYRASISFDKLFYEFGETVTATLKASFYDGTPARGLTFTYNYSGPFSGYGNVQTDASGEAKITIKTGRIATDMYSTRPSTIWISAQLAGFETTQLSAYSSVYYFHSRYQLRYSRVNEDYSEVYLHHTDTSKIKTENDLQYPAYPDNIYGAPAEGTLKIVLRKVEYIRQQVSTEYDPITKTTYPIYSYTTVETTVDSCTKSFSDGIVRLEHIDVKGQTNTDYYYDVSFYDEQNKGSFDYSIYANRNSNRVIASYEWYNARIETDKLYYSVGDRVYAALKKEDTNIFGSTLFTVYDSRGLAGYYVTDGKISFTFTETMVEYAKIYAMTYNSGKRVSVSQFLAYDFSGNNQLKIDISADLAEYMPGERAVVTVKVTDKKSGAPVSGTVTLAVVDEVCFALDDQNTDVDTYYYSIFFNNNFIYSSYAYTDLYITSNQSPFVISIDERFNVLSEIWRDRSISTYNSYGNLETADKGFEYAASAMADYESETGSSPADTATYLRQYFADNPVFVTVSLLSDGTATFSFNVPDNLTEWRLTAVAISGTGSKKLSEHKLGTAKSSVIVTQPFFINLNVCEYYILGDDVTISARAYGSELYDSENVSYKAAIESYDGKVKKSQSTKTKPTEQTWFNFGKLPEGSYSVTVTASSGSASDAVKLDFSVIESANIVDIRKAIGIDELSSIKPKSFPVVLAFSNSVYDMYYDISSLIYRNYVPSRSDARAAYYAVTEAERILFGDTRKSSTLGGAPSQVYITRDLVSLLEYSDGDVELTAKVCAVAPGIINVNAKAGIISALYNIADGKEEADITKIAAALLGLASLGEPVLDRLYYLASVCRDYPLDAKLYIAAALAYIGDFSAASEMYNSLKVEYAIRGEGSELYFKGADREEHIRLSALALIIASRVSRTDATELVTYLKNRPSKSEYYGLEMASYLRFFMPTENKSASFSYSFGNGEITDVKLSAGEIYHLQLTKSGFENLQILRSEGSIRVRAAYKGSPDDAILGADSAKDITITKNITRIDSQLGLYRVDINIKGSTDRDYLNFELSDVIPSGARYVSEFYTGISGYSYRHNYAYIYNSGGQQITGWVWIINPSTKNKWNTTTTNYNFNVTVSYVIRGAVTGEFIAERTLIRNTQTGGYALSNRLSINILDDGWVVKEIK